MWRPQVSNLVKVPLYQNYTPIYNVHLHCSDFSIIKCFNIESPIRGNDASELWVKNYVVNKIVNKNEKFLSFKTYIIWLMLQKKFSVDCTTPSLLLFDLIDIVLPLYSV